MKCPYRKIITYQRLLDGWYASRRDMANFAECYRDECPFYDSLYCRKIKEDLSSHERNLCNM